MFVTRLIKLVAIFSCYASLKTRTQLDEQSAKTKIICDEVMQKCMQIKTRRNQKRLRSNRINQGTCFGQLLRIFIVFLCNLPSSFVYILKSRSWCLKNSLKPSLSKPKLKARFLTKISCFALRVKVLNKYLFKVSLNNETRVHYWVDFKAAIVIIVRMSRCMIK